MYSTECDKCKNKALCLSCDECQSKPYICFICNETITYKEKHNHMRIHFSDPDQFLLCNLCKVNQNISNCRYKQFTCRERVYLRRYRFRHTQERFLD